MMPFETESSLNRRRILDELTALLRGDHLRAHDGVDNGADLLDAMIDASTAVHEDVRVHVVVSSGCVAASSHVDRGGGIEIVLVGGLRGEVYLSLEGVARVSDAIAAVLVRHVEHAVDHEGGFRRWVLHDTRQAMQHQCERRDAALLRELELAESLLDALPCLGHGHRLICGQT